MEHCSVTLARLKALSQPLAPGQALPCPWVRHGEQRLSCALKSQPGCHVVEQEETCLSAAFVPSLL